MLVEMAKVRILGLKAAFPQTLEALYSFGKIQFEDLRPKIESGEYPVQSMQLPAGGEEEREQMVALLQRMRVLCQGLYGTDDCHARDDVPNRFLAVPTAALITYAQELADSAEPYLAQLTERENELQEELAELEKYKPIMEKIAPIVRELNEESDEDLDSVALLVEKKYAAVFENLEDALREMSNDHTRVAQAPPDDGIIPAVVVFDKAYSKPVRDFLKEERTNQVKLPEDLEREPLLDALEMMYAREQELPGRIDDVRSKLDEFGAAQRDEITMLKDALSDEIDELDAILMFGETAYTFFIEGYVPHDELDGLKQTVESVGSEVVMEEAPIEPKDYPDVPVKIENKGGFKRSFQAALGIWGTPRYGQFDPTTILAMSFPVIFGMIVGDAGYGLLMVIMCLILRWKFPRSVGVQNITGVLFPAGIMTILFGFFYFEFFGDLAHVYLPGLNQIHPIHIGDSFMLPFVRTEKEMMTTLLFITLGFGVFEVLLGLVLGIVNGKKTGHTKHMFEKGGILLILLSGILIVVNMVMPQLTASLGSAGAAVVQYVLYFLLAIGFFFTMFGGGIMGAVETLESVSHAASYIRIMAVGLVGALLADAANKLAFETMPNAGGAVIAIVLHILNFAIILFSPSIHALRLSFLEFFGKFFERGSKEYRPFTRAGKEGKS